MFKKYEEAFNAAVMKAREMRDAGLPLDQCEMGIDFNKLFKTYMVNRLPSPKNRYGCELRWEVVRPSDPLMTVK